MLIQISRYVGFVGFIIDMQNVLKIYDLYVVKEKYLKYIATYKMSQDHLELFNASIRSRLGSNNNPTARQFSSVLLDLQLSDCIGKIVEYIAGFVAKKIGKTLLCEICLNALQSNTENTSSLIFLKNRGGLIYLSKDIVNICMYCEKKFRTIINFNEKKSNSRFFYTFQTII